MGSSSSKKNAAATAVAAASGDSSAFVNLLGDRLLNSSGAVSTADALAGKTVGLYFSAHWCPPCRGFTPLLSKAYTADLKAKGLEIVFVSSDRDAAAFSSYFGEMPWLALPFDAREVKSKLSDKYKVQGIPTLVLLNCDGTLLTKDGRAKVVQDPQGKWVPATKPAAAVASMPKAPVTSSAVPGKLGSLIGTEFVATDGKTRLSLSEVAKDAPLIALYFSAHWCGPCRSFTPKLVTFVEALKKEGIVLPVIFGSSDRDAGAFDEYFATMPWYAFPHGDARVDALKSKYEADGIPWLVVLDAQGNLVANEADTMVPQGTPAYHAWLAQAKKQSSTGAPAA